MSDTTTPTMRAKYKVTGVLRSEAGEDITMQVVIPDKFDKDGLSEDNTFAKWSPSGSLTISVRNPALFGKLNPGEKFYLDFTKAE